MTTYPYLQDDNGNEIVLNTEVTVTKQVLSFFNFKIKGNFSTNFSIPNTSSTRRSLGYSGVNQSTRVAFSAQRWNLLKDGNLLTRGFLVIQGDTRDSLDCFFASGNASWLSLLTGNLKDLKWSDYDQDFTYTNLDSIKSNTTGMVFPLLDWGYNFKKLTNEFQIQPLYDSSASNEKFYYDFYPCFYLKTIVKEIAKQKQIKVLGNIFQDPIFDKMVIPLPYIDRRLEDPIFMTHNGGANQNIGAGATVSVTFTYQSNSDSLLDLSGNRILIDDRSRNIRLKTYFKFDAAFTGEVYIRKNGSTISTYAFTVDTITRYEVLSLLPGDYIEVQIKNNSGSLRIISEKYFGYEICGSWYHPGLKILAADTVPNSNIINILKYITQAFNCIVDFDDFTQTITLNKIDSVLKENATNLTDSIIDYEVQWQNDFAKNNYVRTNQTEDISAFNNGELKFGEFVFDGPENGKDKNDLFELKFGPSIIKR